jgi:hypothetical protein
LTTIFLLRYYQKAIYTYFDHILLILVPLIMCKLLLFGHFTILHIQIHFQIFYEN